MDNFTTVKCLVYFPLLSETSTSEGCKIMDRSQNIPALSQTAAVCDFIRVITCKVNKNSCLFDQLIQNGQDTSNKRLVML